MAVSIKKNFLYSSVLTVSNYLFPFLTYPYVSRVLGVTNIGICNFVDSIINYFILLSMMGISILGIREIAGAKDDVSKLNRTFSSLFLLNSMTTAIALIAVVIAIYTVPQLYEHRKLMLIGILKLISNFFLIEWFYKGLENFKYVTKVTLTTKCLYVVAIFAFIHTPSDYPVYYLLSTLMITGNPYLARTTKTIPNDTIIQNKSPESGVNNDMVRYFIGTTPRNIRQSRTGRLPRPTRS